MELEQWAEKIKAGEKQYFNQLVKHYQQQIFNFSYRMIGSREDAKDITQEIFLKVYKGLSGYDAGVKLSTWIYKIATNTCIDYLRKKKEVLFGPDGFPEITNEQVAFANGWAVAGPEQIVESRELSRRIYEKMNLLPEKYKTVIILKYVNELTFDEISAVVNEPVNTVKTRLYRGREILKDMLVADLPQREDD